MLKIKSQQNQKLLINFSNQAFPNISIITTTSRYNLNVAYLVIDSEYFNKLSPDTTQVNLSYLPEKQLVQVLRALYGDQLVVYSISELELLYKVIHQLQIQEYTKAIVNQIMNSKELMENLEILQFCVKNQLIVDQIKNVHIQNNLRALESNKNFLQLNKISLATLIPLLIQYYDRKSDQTTIINNIMQNYFNRNNIRPVEFFQQHDVEVLLRNLEQFHHFLHIQKKPQLNQTIVLGNHQQENIQDIMRKSGLEKPRTQAELNILKEKQLKIIQLQNQIEQQNKLKQKLSKQLCGLKAEMGKIYSTKRIPGNAILGLEEQDEISLIQAPNIGKKEMVLKNIKSETSAQTKNRTPGRLGIGHKGVLSDI